MGAVGWMYEDEDVPLGSTGTVTNIQGEKVWVRFKTGIWTFDSDELFRVGVENFGFRTGEPVLRNICDSDAASNTPGIVIGFKDTSVRARFSTKLIVAKPDQLLHVCNFTDLEHKW